VRPTFPDLCQALYTSAADNASDGCRESEIWPMVQLPWYERAWFTKSVTSGFVLLVVVKAVHSIFFKTNDFDVHLAWGRMAFDGAVLSIPPHYPPGRLLINEGLSFLPRL